LEEKYEERIPIDKLKRANPSSWADYVTASITVKVVTPAPVYNCLKKYLLQELRQPRQLKIFDDSAQRVRKNALRNRLTDVFNRLDFDHYLTISNGALIVNLKRQFCT